MRIEIDSQELKRGLNRVEKVAGGYKTIPALMSILMKATTDKVELTGFDLSTGVVSELHCFTPEDGELLIPAKPFGSFVKACPDGLITIVTEGQKATIKTGNFHCNIECLPVSEFPVLPLNKELFDKQKTKLSSSSLNCLLDYSYASCKESTRPMLCGLSIKTSSPTTLSVASTDGHRLCYGKNDYEGGLSLATQGIIAPKAWVETTQKLLAEHLSDDSFIYVDDKVVAVENGGVTIFGNLLLGEFPEYESILAEEVGATIRFKVNKQELSQAMKVASAITSEKAIVLKYESDNTIGISFANDSVNGAGNFTVTPISNTDKFSTGCNPFYIIDALDHIPNDDVIISQADDSSPLFISGESSDQVTSLHLVMPIRIS